MFTSSLTTMDEHTLLENNGRAKEIAFVPGGQLKS
jgi:hypothetical protein